MNNQEYLSDMWKKIEEKERAGQIIDYIDTLPKKINLKKFIFFLFREIGILNLFRNMRDIILISYAVTFLVMYGSTQYVSGRAEEIYGLAFLISPILYGCIFTLSCLKEKQRNTLAIQMSCKYTFWHIITLRMAAISILSLAINYIYVWGLASIYPVSFSRLLVLTFTAQVLFAAMMAGTLFITGRFTGILAVPGIWYLLNGILYNGIRGLYIRFLEGTSLLIFCFISMSALILYISIIKNMMEEKRRNLDAAIM